MKTQLIILSLILAATGYSLANSLVKPDESVYYAESPVRADARSALDEFTAKTDKGEPAVLNVSYRDISDKRIVFNGADYEITDEYGTKRYMYFYEVPTFHWYILADKKYNSVQIRESALSSNSKDRLDYVLVCAVHRFN